MSGNFFRLGIRQKVILVLIIVLLTALSVSSWLTLQQEKHEAIAQIHQRGTDISRFLAKSLAYSVVGYDYHTMQLLLDEITHSSIVSNAKVINMQGRVMAQAGDWENLESVTSFSQNIVLGQNPVGKLITGISAADTLAKLEKRKNNKLSQDALVIFLIAIGEFIALSLIIIKPVRVITQSLKSKVDDQGRINGEIPVTTNDEFGALAQQFNELSKELNSVNDRLHSKINLADEELQRSNRRLLEQSMELKKVSEEFKHLSITDSLTGLYNRRYYEVLMEAEISMALRYEHNNSLLIVDVDNFSPINDKFGHYMGDQVLKEIAMRLKLVMRKTDTLCRFAGEEFIAFCKDAKAEDSINIAEKMRQSVTEMPIVVNNQSFNLTISIGVATMPGKEPINSIEEFYRQADVALYESKHGGRNTSTHYEHLKKVKEA